MTRGVAVVAALAAGWMGAMPLAGCNNATTTAAPVSAPAPGPAPPQDQYGGVAMSVGRPTGYFQVQQVGDRWMFLTPEGNGLWMLGVFGVIYSDSVDDLGTSGHSRIVARYGGGADWQNKWRQHAAQRLKAWGFNTLAEYHHWAMRPGPLPDPNPVRLPYIHIAKPAFYGLDNRYGYGRGPFKDLIHATDPQFYTNYRGGQVPDVFDPNFEAYVDGWMRNDDGLRYGNIGNAWMLGISMDDADNLFGFGPGPELPAARIHPHLGWVVLVTDFQQSSSPWVASYADPRVYSKYALRDFLAARYGTIAALNAAWGATYSSFDSNGGWGRGTGLLDENGRHPWVGNERDELAGAAAAVKTDLDGFLYEYAKRYFTVMASKIRQYAPHHLVFGPASFNGWGGLTRKEILKAAGETVDVVQCAISGPEALARTARYVGNRPLVTWDTFVANPDSALWRYPVPREQPPWPPQASTQEDRGRLYAQKMDFLFGTRSPAGAYVVAGMKFWSYGDNWGEKMNFGLVTFSENAYDGREAAAARGTDPWGYPVGGEERSYGDFLSAVRNANSHVQEQLVRYGRSASAGRAPRAADLVAASAAP